MNKPPKVLYVDDEHINLVFFESIFSNFFDVSLASSGNEALEMLKKEQFDIVFVDMNMPEMNGLELIDLSVDMRLNPRFIMISAYSLTNEIHSYLEDERLEAFVQKPYSPPQLLNVVG
ncbi:MAG: response regulator [Cyclobacteriaceae bacterium]